MKLRYLIGLGALVCCSTRVSAQNIEITNFKSGLICPQKFAFMKIGTKEGSVCFETEDIYMTGQGLCEVNGEPRQCDWYGYEFNYSGAKNEQEITCVWTSSKNSQHVGPEGYRGKLNNTETFTFKLPSNSGRFYNPQYSVFRFSDGSSKIVTHNTVCSDRDRELFRFKFNTIFPAAKR